MPVLPVSEITLTSLNITILTLAITLYLLNVKHKTRPTLYLAGAFGCFSLFGIVSMINGADDLYLRPIIYLCAGLSGAMLIQFAYHFSRLLPAWEKEARVVLFLSLALNIIQLIIIFLLPRSFVTSSGFTFYMLPTVEVGWAVIILFRQLKHIDGKNRSIWQNFVSPATQAAGACRAFLFSFGFLLLIPLFIVITTALFNPAPPMHLATVNIGFLLFIFTATVVYLNHAREAITFMAKLVGISLITMLIILGNLWILIIPLAEALFQESANLPQENQTLRFTPNQSQSYDIAQVPFQFDSNTGQPLPFDRTWQPVSLPFPFPFYGQEYSQVFVSPNGIISFNPHLPTLNRPDVSRLPFPAIMPLLGDLIPVRPPQSGLYYKATDEKLTITWQKVSQPRLEHSPDDSFSVQVTLYPGGQIDLTFDRFTLPQQFVEFRFLWAIGLHPGQNTGYLPLDFHADSDYGGTNKQAIFQNYNHEFTIYMHRHLAPFAWLVIGASLLIIFGFPVFFRANLVSPLQQLVLGVKKVNTGNLDVEVPVKFNDEIGFLATSFNGMLRNLKQAETEKLRAAMLEKEKEAAEAANQAKSAFLTNMSHELRSPLNAILGFAQILQRNSTLGGDSRENLGIIMRSGEHLPALINQVLDLSKIEAGRATLDETSFDFYRLLDDLEDMLALKANEKRLQFLFKRHANVPQYICADEVKLRQVLINLLNNALKFTQEGEVTLRVGVRSQELGARGLSPFPNSQPLIPISFEVSDAGPGIAPDEMEKLFEAFSQTESGRKSQEGTGLGLPISRKFVQLMGGDISVSSEINRGTTFTFHIQVEVVEAAQVERTTASIKNQVVALKPGQPGYRILIVDDKPTNRQLLVKLLNPLGFELQEAENGQQAVEIWQKWQPHLIWMDMRMPVMNGYEATQQIKATAKGQDTVIVALTASSFEEERAIILDAGCDDFVRKPFRTADIFNTMQKHIGVQYVYKQPHPQPAGEFAKQLTAEELQTALAAAPLPVINNLLEATELSDMEKIDQAIIALRAHHAGAADAVAGLADNYAYDEILQLIQKIEQLEDRTKG